MNLLNIVVCFSLFCQASIGPQSYFGIQSKDIPQKKPCSKIIIIKHIGMTDKMFYPIILGTAPPSKRVINEFIKIYNQYIPKYYYIELNDNEFEKCSEVLADFTPRSQKDESFYFGSITIVSISKSASKTYYFNFGEDSRKLIFSLLKGLKKDDTETDKFWGLEHFYCTLIDQNAPCIEE